MKTRTMQPGDKGASRRKFHSESELAEATECPLFVDGTHPALQWPEYLPAASRDSHVCYGPDCPKWFANTTNRDDHGAPIRAEVGCLANGRTNAMGIIERKPEGSRQ